MLCAGSKMSLMLHFSFGKSIAETSAERRLVDGIGCVELGRRIQLEVVDPDSEASFLSPMDRENSIRGS